MTQFERRLEGKVVIVTGAGRGIGRATAELFAGHGASVVAVDVSKEALRATKADLAADGVQGEICDISDGAAVVRLFSEVEAHYSKVDVLVNVAGIAGQGRALADVDDCTWQKMLDVNLSGTFYCTRAAALSMVKKQLAGSIVSVSSTGALSGESAVHYDAAKGALLSMTRSLARELGPQGIRVNAICPGPTNTELLSGLKPEQVQALTRRIPLKRMGEPEDIAAAALYLASDEAAFVTGQTLMVNGGSWFL